MITSRRGNPASVLGLAAQPGQDVRCIRRAFDRGINYFFFYGPGHKEFLQGLAPLARKHRDDIIVATGSGSRKPGGLLSARRKLLAALGVETIDLFFAEYISEADDPEAVFGTDGLFDQLQQWKSEGVIRYVGATTHDQRIARRLAEDPRVDVLMHRLNMAHRKAVQEVFPAAERTKTPVVAFTATRWGTLLEARDGWNGDLPTAAECYRFCLAYPAVHLVLTAPKTLAELDENVAVLFSRRMTKRDLQRWERFGDLVYASGSNKFETMWP